MPDSQDMQEADSQFVTMQHELHSKGVGLTKAWSDLFSFITKYQAELVVKENAVEIAKKEIHVRKKLLGELEPAATTGTEEIVMLQEEVLTKERLLSQFKSKLFVKEQMLLRVESDLNDHKEQLDQSRSELLERQSDLIRHRSDLESLKSELTIKEEQLRSKDNMMHKLRHQLMKENAELKEELDAKNQCLDMERRSFEAERRAYENLKQRLHDISPLKSSNTIAPVAVGTKDSQSSLDLCVEPCDIEITNIRSVSTEPPSQPMEQDPQLSALPNQATDTSRSSSHVTTSLSATFSQDLSQGSPPSKVARRTKGMKNVEEMFSDSDSSHASAGETYFPISVSQDSDSSVSEQPSNTHRTRSYKGRPMSRVSDVDTNGSAEVGAEVKPIARSPHVVTHFGMGEKWACSWCGISCVDQERFVSHSRTHMEEQRKPFRCTFCLKTFNNGSNFTKHLRIHTGVKPYVCHCGKAFSDPSGFRRHKVVHLKL